MGLGLEGGFWIVEGEKRRRIVGRFGGFDVWLLG